MIRKWISLIGLAVGSLLLPVSLCLGEPPVKQAATPPAAENKFAYTPPAWPEAPSVQNMVLRLGVGTCIVLTLCGGTLWLGKRWLQGQSAKHLGGSQLQVLQTLILNPTCKVLLVKAGDHRILVGMDRMGLKSVVALPEEADQSLIELASDQTPKMLEKAA